MRCSGDGVAGDRRRDHVALIAIPIGILSALRPRSLLDTGLMVFVLVGVSAHPVWLWLMLSYFLGAKLQILPCRRLLQLLRARTSHCGGRRSGRPTC